MNFPFFVRHASLAALSALLGLAGSAIAQGSAVATLVAPPPGGDGYSALQTGGAFSTGATSLYYNPALLPDLARANGSQVHFTHSRQDIKFFDADQNFTGLSVSVPDPVSGFDVGLGFFRNDIDFGESPISGEDGEIFDANETVYGLGLGLRLGLPVSIGGAVKYYDSRMHAISGQGSAQGWAFDIGLAATPRFQPLAFKEIASLDVAPSAGIALQNLGADAYYTDFERADPLPRLLRESVGLRMTFADALDVSAGYDWEHDWHRRASRNDPPVRTYGVSAALLGLRYSAARLADRAGVRHEKHSAIEYAFEGLPMYRFWKRVQQGDFASASETMEAGYPFGHASVLGMPYRFSPRFVLGLRRIEGGDGDFRGGQKAWYGSISL